MHSSDDFALVKELQAVGLSDYQTAAVTGISRGTLQRWRHREVPPAAAFRGPRAGKWNVEDVPSYCYLLGVYLGDGWATHRPPNGWTLKIACDGRYEQSIAEVTRALAQTFPGSPVRRRHLSSAASEVISLSHPAIGFAFPQHGPGRTHQRRSSWPTGSVR